MDVQHVLTHELGHVLGFDDDINNNDGIQTLMSQGNNSSRIVENPLRNSFKYLCHKDITSTTGLEDCLMFSSNPEQLNQNSTYQIEAYGIDEEPYDGDGTCDLKLYARSTSGSVLLNSTDDWDFYLHWTFNISVPSLSNYNKTWLIENNCILGYLKLEWNGLTTYENILISPPYDNGELFLDDVLSGNVNISGNLTVPQNVKLTIQQNTNITFASNTSLTVNGTLDAQGTSSEQIVFTSSGTWDGIKLVNAGTSTLEYCEIENASNGIYLDNSSPNITQCYIHNNSYDGIYMKGGSDPELKNNTIKNNSYNGIFCSDYSEPDLGDYSQAGSEGNNRIFDNQTGINATSNSYVMAGVFYNQQVPRCYNNSIYNNTYWDAGASNADIVAQFDWWGTDNPDPSQFSTANGGTINHSAELSSDPGGGSSLAKSVASRLASSSFDPDNIDQDDPDDLWKLAQYYRFKKEIEKAIETNKEIIGRFSSTIYASKAMCQVFHIFEKQKRDGLKIYLKSMREKQLRGELKETVIDLSIIKSIRDKNYSQAIQLCKNVLEKLPDTRSELLALHNLVTLNNQMSNRKDATEYIDILKKKYPDSRLTLMAREIMGENVDWSGAKHYQTEDPQVAETDLPETLELSSVSPNPFNPTTNIRFVLPEAARVDISVYNLLGKRVWSHQSNNFKAGYHSVAWHGVDNTGSKVSSGIYIIRIRSKNQQATQKVMLMK